MTDLAIPQLCLVVLIGASGSGKSTFAATHFGPFEVLSSDFCRGLVSDDENDQQATAAAFDVLRFIAGKRLAAGRLTVIDATNVAGRIEPSWSSWPASTTCCRSRWCSMCPSRGRRRATPRAPTGSSGPMSSGGTGSCCVAP